MRLVPALLSALALAGCTERIPLPVVDGAAIRAPADAAVSRFDVAPLDPQPDSGPRADLRSGETAFCIERLTYLRVRPEIPSVIIALDRSASMFANRVNDVSRLAMVHAALRPVLDRFQGSIHFGYQEFPSRSPLCIGCCAGGVRVHPAPNRAALISSEMRCDDRTRDGGFLDSCTQTTGDSPAFQALQVCDEYYDDQTSTPKYVVLVTDGDPTCANVSSPCDRTAAEAADLLRDRVQTIVVGVSEEARASACLERIALSGGMPPRASPPSYFHGDTEVQLRAQLTEALSTVAARSCRILLEGQGSFDVNRLTVAVGGVAIPRDPLNGWMVETSSPARIRLFGQACDQVKTIDAQEDVEVRGQCTVCLGTPGCRP